MERMIVYDTLKVEKSIKEETNMKKEYTVWKLFAGYLLILLLMIMSSTASAQTKIKKVPQDGVVVVEFNAGWNTTTPSVSWIKDLSDCKTGQLLICENPKYQTKYKIVVVPTIIVFKDGEIMETFPADIMMKMIHTLKDVQGAVDEAHMEGF